MKAFLLRDNLLWVLSLGSIIIIIRIVPIQAAGLFQTHSGYDRFQGKNAICWQTFLQRNQPQSETDTTELLRDCPGGNSLTAQLPLHNTTTATTTMILRTHHEYLYPVVISLNISSWNNNGSLGFFGTNSTKVSVTVMACRVGTTGGLCSPFLVDNNNEDPTAVAISEEDAGAILQSDPVLLKPLLEPDNHSHSVYQIRTDVPFRVNTTGEYQVIVALQIIMERMVDTTIDFSNSSETTTTTIVRLDMANALQPSNLVTYQAPPNILTIPRGVRYGGYAAVAVAGSVLVFLLVEVIRHRKHTSLRMAQGRFLIAFVLAGLSAVIGSVLLEPRNDIYCQWGLSAVLMSLQLFYAITVGRVWRIYSVISPAVLQAMDCQPDDTWAHTLFFTPLQRYTSWLLNWENRTRPKRLYKTFTETQLLLVIAILTIPQVVIQVLAAVYQPWQLALEMNADESIGRQYCALPEDLSYGSTIFYYGMYLFIMLLLMLLIMARATRGLPSLFNESQVIFNSLVSSIFLLVLGLGVVFGTSSPTTSPGVPYLVAVVIILFVTLQSSLRLILPKLKLAWKNESIIVSQLVTEHSQQVRKKQAKRGVRRDTSLNGSASCASFGSIGAFTTNSTHVHVTGLLEATKPDNNPPNDADMGSLHHLSLGSIEFDDAPDSRPKGNHAGRSNQKDQKGSPLPNILLEPPWEAVLKAMELEKCLTDVTKRSLAGVQVAGEEWQKIRRVCREFERVFLFEEYKQNVSCESSGSIGVHTLSKYSSVDDEERGNVGDTALIDGEYLESENSNFLHKKPGNTRVEPAVALEALGEGPMRFAHPRRPLQTQVASLSQEDQHSLHLLRADWKEDANANEYNQFMTGEMILRFFRQCQEVDAEKKQLAIWRAMKGYDVRYLSLTAQGLERQLLTKTLFPIPGLKTLDGHSVFYMKPSRFSPLQTSTSEIIDNLVYCIQTMLEDETSSTDGIGFVANMDDWTMKHFSLDYCFHVSPTGRFPCVFVLRIYSQKRRIVLT